MHRVEVRVAKFNHLKDALNHRTAEVKSALAYWDNEYRKFTLRRFRKFSAGGGNWAALKPATLRAKRRKYGARRARYILQASKLLIKNLTPTFSNFVNSRSTSKGLRVVVKVGGNVRYPSGTLLSRVIVAHQRGQGALPVRLILVGPDAATRSKMTKKMKAALVARAKRR